MPEVLQIDVSKLDDEISQLEFEYDKIKKELDAKRFFKEQLLAASKLYATSVSNGISLNEQGKFEISEFILNYLKVKGETPFSVLANEFARVTKKTYESARSNISNALTRLKIAGKVDNKKDKEGVAIWFLK